MTKNGTIVAVDLDEVLFPLRRAMVESFNAMNGTDLVFDNPRIYSLAGYLQRKHPDFYKLLQERGGDFAVLRHGYESGLLRSVTPFPGTVEALRRLIEDEEVVILTMRGAYNPDRVYSGLELRETVAWLRAFDIPYDNLLSTRDKGEALDKLEATRNKRIRMLVEDHPSNAASVVRRGFKVALVDKPYNQPEIEDDSDAPEVYRNGPSQIQWDGILRSGLVTRISSLSDLL